MTDKTENESVKRLAASGGEDDLLAAFRAGDQSAAETLFARYYARLLELVRREMGWRIRDAEDSADVALSALQSFFDELRQRRIVVRSNHDLWPLLVTITLNKIRNKGRFWKRQRRDRRRLEDIGLDEPLQRGASPDDAVALQEIVELLLSSFPERRRRILDLTLQGFPVKEVARLVGTTERTVYNTRRAASAMLERMLEME